MKKILFVDDETNVLNGMKRQLRSYRKEWDMMFVDSGQAAIDLMRTTACDVIMTDMRMPGMDGVALLGHVREHHPRTVRIVLSGHAEVEAALKVAPIAHQFLSKPCEPSLVREVITRSCGLHLLMDDAVLQEVVGAIDTLPALPSVYDELIAAAADPEVSIGDVAAIVERDVSMTVKVLQLVNSSFFGIARSMSDLREATSYLGMNMIQSLTMSMEVFRAFDGDRCSAGFSIEKQQAHSALCGRIARNLVDDERLSEDAFLAARLHDVGTLILATSSPASHERATAAALERHEPVHTMEQELDGVSHAQIGAYLLGLWGLPYSIVEAVAHHHFPARVEHQTFGALGAVHVADALAHELTDAPQDPPTVLDVEYLDSMGVLDRLPEWRDMAAAEAGPARDEAA